MIKALYFFCMKFRLKQKHDFWGKICDWLMLHFDNYAIWGIDSLPYPKIKGLRHLPNPTGEYISRGELEGVFTDFLDAYYGRIVWRKRRKKEQIVENTILALLKTISEGESLWEKK
jgi:hypothetical protein